MSGLQTTKASRGRADDYPQSNSRGYDDEDEYGGLMEEDGMQKMSAPADFDGPTGRRQCTDILCSLLLLLSWVAMTGVGVYAVTNGDYRIILYPMDYAGNICGTNYGGQLDMTDFPYIYFVNGFGGGVCVSECPNLEDKGLVDPYTLITYGGVYQAEHNKDLALVDTDFISMPDYSVVDDFVNCTNDDLCYPNSNPLTAWSLDAIRKGSGYAFFVLDTNPFLYRCISNDDAIAKLANETGVPVDTDIDKWLLAQSDDEKFWTRLYSDLYTARVYVFVFGFVIAVVVAFAYAFFLRIPGVLSTMVWGSIFGTIAMFVAAGYYASNTASQWADEEPQVQKDGTILATRAGALALWVVGGLFFLIVCFLRKAIMLAMGTVKETSKAIAQMSILIFFPIIQAFGFLAFFAIWIVYCIQLASLGELKRGEIPIPADLSGGTLDIGYRYFEFDEKVERAGWYLLFCFFWTSQFIFALGEIIIAMCVAKWYFTRDKSTINSLTVLKSIFDAFWFHNGTAAFGSLLLALIQILRALLARLQKKARQINSKVAQAVLCCCQCLLWCFQKCVKFLNKNAYIQTAIFGTNFCRSAREAFFLILRNAGRIGAIEFISEGVVIIGKVFITALAAGISYFLIEDQLQEDLHSIVGPVVFVAIISYFVAGMFLSVFDMGMATILQCFVADEEMFDGAQNYAQGDLRKWIDDYEHKARSVAA